MTASNQTLRTNAVFLERLFSKYGRPLQEFLRRRMASDEDANDAAQEVFLRLARPGAREAAEGRERAYLFTAARNLLIDRHRRGEARSAESAVPLAEADALPAPDDTEQLVITQETAAVLRRGLSSLKRRDREVFVLHRFANLGYRQIALRLGVSERTVERRMSRTLSHLRRTLDSSVEMRPCLRRTSDGL
ncbi:MAG: sigma-70 family RNA polymerase sigma factor [Acidobacteriota bacterium]